MLGFYQVLIEQLYQPTHGDFEHATSIDTGTYPSAAE